MNSSKYRRNLQIFFLPILRSRRLALCLLGALLVLFAFLIHPAAGIAVMAILPAGVMPDVEFQQNVLAQLDALSHRQLASKRSVIAETGQVSPGCARHIGSLAVAIALKRGQIRNSGLQRLVDETLSPEQRSSLTSSDIPLPTEYGQEVVALVSSFGDARRYGTVFPLGVGTVKLPRLGTDTAFGLIGASATVTEKSPTVVHVTFAAEKFGGLVRFPAEIGDDFEGLGQFLATYCARQIASVEDQVFFLNLDGSTYGAVAGLCASTITNSKVVQMASTKTHYSDATLANLRAIRGVPDAAALGGSAYYMHPTFEQLLSTFNSAGDRPYNPLAQLQGSGANPFNMGPTLDGFPVRWVSKMPAYSTSANASKVFVLFGDLRFQYLGVRGGIRFDTSIEGAFTTDEILIRALERFTIGLMATGAVGGLQTAAS